MKATKIGGRLPSDSVLTGKLESARADAKILHDALKEVPDADFPVVQESYQQVTGHWQSLLKAAEAQVSGTCSDPGAGQLNPGLH